MGRNRSKSPTSGNCRKKSSGGTSGENNCSSKSLSGTNCSDCNIKRQPPERRLNYNKPSPKAFSAVSLGGRGTTARLPESAHPTRHQGAYFPGGLAAFCA